MQNESKNTTELMKFLDEILNKTAEFDATKVDTLNKNGIKVKDYFDNLFYEKLEEINEQEVFIDLCYECKIGDNKEESECRNINDTPCCEFHTHDVLFGIIFDGRSYGE